MTYDTEITGAPEMNAKELAAALNGREYGKETTGAEEASAKDNRLVVVFGASDDLMEFRGAIHDEIGGYGGVDAYLVPSGLLTNECDNDDCPHFKRLQETATVITAKWGEGDYSWTYDTKIPHEVFDVMEDGDKYCRGIVFALADVP